MSMDLSGAAIQPYKSGIWVRNRRPASMNEEYGRGVENVGMGDSRKGVGGGVLGVKGQKGNLSMDGNDDDESGEGKSKGPEDLEREQPEQQEEEEDMDVPNELKAIVILETLMKAADISTLMMVRAMV